MPPPPQAETGIGLQEIKGLLQGQSQKRGLLDLRAPGRERRAAPLRPSPLLGGRSRRERWPGAAWIPVDQVLGGMPGAPGDGPGAHLEAEEER